MNYKLAKQLKDAGFLQEVKFLQWSYDKNKKKVFARTLPIGKKKTLLNHKMSLDKDSVKIPTLSELIEECGKEFQELTLEKEGLAKGQWFAEAVLTIRDVCPKCKSWEYKSIVGQGKTPEEAVAKLYLKLNEK